MWGGIAASDTGNAEASGQAAARRHRRRRRITSSHAVEKSIHSKHLRDLFAAFVTPLSWQCHEKTGI
jgi:hypothetical protein